MAEAFGVLIVVSPLSLRIFHYLPASQKRNRQLSRPIIPTVAKMW